MYIFSPQVSEVLLMWVCNNEMLEMFIEVVEILWRLRRSLQDRQNYWTKQPIKRLELSQGYRISGRVKVCIGHEKATVTPLITQWHLILLPKMRQKKGRAEEDTIHADKRSISLLAPDLQWSWNNIRRKKRLWMLLEPHVVIRKQKMLS